MLPNPNSLIVSSTSNNIVSASGLNSVEVTKRTAADRLRESRARHRAKREPGGVLSCIPAKELAKLSVPQRLSGLALNLRTRIPGLIVLENETLASGWQNRRSTIIWTCEKHGGNYQKPGKYVWDYVRHACPHCREEASEQNAKNHSIHMRALVNNQREKLGAAPLTAKQQLITEETTKRRTSSRVTRSGQKGFCYISGQKLTNLIGPHGRPLLGAASTCGDSHHLMSGSLYPTLKHVPQNLIYIHKSIHQAYHKVYGIEKYSNIEQMIKFVQTIYNSTDPNHLKIINLIQDFGFYNLSGELLTFNLNSNEIIANLQSRADFLNSLLV